MKKDELLPYEGNVVCFCHLRKKEDAIPSRWVRGIVYQGVCYDLSTVQEGRPAKLQVRLRAVKPEYLAELFFLYEYQQTPLETTVCAALRRGETKQVLLDTPLLFDTWPEDKKEEEEKTIGRRNTTPPLCYSI